jgi:hypothetical protein
VSCPPFSTSRFGFAAWKAAGSENWASASIGVNAAADSNAAATTILILVVIASP